MHRTANFHFFRTANFHFYRSANFQSIVTFMARISFMVLKNKRSSEKTKDPQKKKEIYRIDKPITEKIA